MIRLYRFINRLYKVHIAYKILHAKTDFGAFLILLKWVCCITLFCLIVIELVGD